jgi:hypothetical protein
MKDALKIKVYPVVLLVMMITLAMFLQNCTKEKVVIYGQLPPKVRLLAPPNIDSIYVAVPVFVWEKQSSATGYQIQIASDVAFTGLMVETTVSDTSYTHSGVVSNGQYFWRVRAKNANGIWGDWSDASIWSFHVNDNSNYIVLLASFMTLGIPQDVFVEGNIAYVADGEADLTLVDITDHAQPTLIGNIDTGSDDFSKAVWKRPGDNYAYVADMDGKLQVLDVSLPINPYAVGNANLGLDQNLEDLLGFTYRDSLYIFTVASGGARTQVLRSYRIMSDSITLPQADPFYQPNAIILPADAMGLCYDTMSVYVKYQNPKGGDSTYYEYINGQFIYVADASSGLFMVDISRTHPFEAPDSVVKLIGNPRTVGSGDSPAVSLSVQTKGRYAYVADDRGGLSVFGLPDTIPAYDNLVQLTVTLPYVGNLNTSGRTKDLQIVGDYCFLADGSGGLKVVSIADPVNPVFVAAYTTPYAYGIWADQDYIYITDRDNGLMIFENRVF